MVTKGGRGEYRLDDDYMLMNGEASAGISVADLSIAIADDSEYKHICLNSLLGE
ncbi:hypothetical protein GNY91_09915 [Glaesserella parasuis]|uniref:hypothetical protein n=1 Tax=Glaesserella parasuis TaxID=738 RepID=UPI0002C99CB7|nr:hypothetical protein [Glaesserella parasuis]EMY45368.1 hypothetical protein OE7_10079 [Glaesserella parasuis gx033]MDG6283073.1 hypothetical protein [Glaesserella parasuis]MDO9649663.1 hypothetical protein [Glaesserella parasuis]MDP0044114.1 hypothetical protein [Glaesserella parasuis]MDP0050339.1 hypothetical protein [Glaesserella parasuis]